MLSFNFERGEGLLAAAARSHLLVELSKTDAGSGTGVSGATSSFFDDPLLPVHLRIYDPSRDCAL